MAVDVSDSEDSERSKSDRHGGVTVLDQDDDRVPTEEEVLEFAEYLGIDLEKEQDLLWIAREGVVAPVPAPWKACTENGDDVFYFNFETGESIWDHPADERYRQLLQEKREEQSAPSRTSKSAVPESKASSDTATSLNEATKGSNKPSSLDSTKDAENGKNEPDPNSSVSASVEESFSASASLSVSESASTSRRSEGKGIQGILKKDARLSLDLSEVAGSPDAPEKDGLAGAGLSGAREAASQKEPFEAEKKETLSEAEKKESSKSKEIQGEASIEKSIEKSAGKENFLEVLEESRQTAPGAKVEPGRGVKFVDTDDDRVPTEEEVLEFAEYLGIDLEKEQDLLWIAREGVVAPVPAPWKACTENGDDVFYFNFETGESIWDHPADERYRQLLQEKREEQSAPSRTSKSTVPESKASSDTATSLNEATKGSNKPSSLDSTKDAENGKNEPDPNSSVSASVEESFSASASLSVSESAEKPSPDTDGGELKRTAISDGKVQSTSSPLAGVGLAGVGLGGARLGGPVSVPKDLPEAEKKCEASLEEIEEEDGLEGLEGSSQSAPVTKVEPKGASGVAGSSASELSEDFMSEGSPNSSFLAPPVSRARSNSIGGDTLELSVSASAVDQSTAEFPLELEVASLARSLAMLRKIRESQREYLELLLNSNPGNI